MEYVTILHQYFGFIYNKPFGESIRDFHGAFTQMWTIACQFNRWLLNYDKLCKQHRFFPIVFYIAIIFCTAAIVRCILNFGKIKCESGMLSKKKHKLSPTVIYWVRMMCQAVQLISFCFLIGGLIRYSGEAVTPWIIREYISIILGFLKHLWVGVVHKKELNLIFGMELLLRSLFVVFVFSLKNFFETTEVDIKDILWF